MLESSIYLAFSVYCCCCLLAAIASCALPIETTGRGLQESSHREWGQEMMGRAPTNSPGRIPHSSASSQGWRPSGCEATTAETRRSRKQQNAGPAVLDHLQSILCLFSFRHRCGFTEPGSTIFFTTCHYAYSLNHHCCCHFANEYLHSG